MALHSLWVLDACRLRQHLLLQALPGKRIGSRCRRPDWQPTRCACAL